jgi:hypothetical protein
MIPKYMLNTKYSIQILILNEPSSQTYKIYFVYIEISTIYMLCTYIHIYIYTYIYIYSIQYVNYTACIGSSQTANMQSLNKHSWTSKWRPLILGVASKNIKSISVHAQSSKLYILSLYETIIPVWYKYYIYRK